jgi:hypothetical protein
LHHGLRDRGGCNLEIDRTLIFDLCPLHIKGPETAPKSSIDDLHSEMRALDRFARIHFDLATAILF